jgi:hypothetical protein
MRCWYLLMLFCVFYFNGMSILQEIIQVSGTRRHPFADVALQNLKIGNLSAKYSPTGHLSKLIVICQLNILLQDT